MATTIEYLGREISKEGVMPGKKKIQAVLDMPYPRNVKQIRQFLGLASFFRKFVKNFSMIAEPLTRLTRKNVIWTWNAPQKQAFHQIQQALTSCPILAIYNPKLKTELHTDASSIGLGAMLLQFDSEGKQHVFSYFSKQTTCDQRQYHSYELETMAVVYALKYFRVYLLGIHFKVITDCNALRTTLSKRDLIPRIGRWWLEIQEYSFEIEYRAGKKMTHVDALSRNPIAGTDLEVEVFQIDLTEADWITAAQLQDEQISRIRKILANKIKNSDTKLYFNQYELKGNKLYRKLENGNNAWVVPRAARMQICRLCHDDSGHLGIEKVLQRIRENYWFAKMRKFVTKYVNACLNCMYYKRTSSKRECKLNPIEKYPIPFHTLHVDHVGPFVTSKKKNKYIFVIVDAFTKFTVVEPVHNQKSKHVIKVLTDLIYLFGVPTRIISDRGTAFTSQTFRIFCDTYGIKHILNAVATPRSNGQCERYNKTIVSALSTTAAGKDERDWDKYVKQVQSALNTSFNRGINSTPMTALIGYNSKHAAEATILNEVKDEIDRLDLEELRSKISDHIKEDQKKQKKRYDKTRRNATKYDEGDLVRILITSIPTTGASHKLDPKYKGPFRITKVIFNDRYEVEDLREGFKRKRTIVAADHIKKWISIQNEDD